MKKYVTEITLYFPKKTYHLDFSLLLSRMIHSRTWQLSLKIFFLPSAVGTMHGSGCRLVVVRWEEATTG
ncbi:hypothetical protein WN943_005995 [Citrus x changshan-huyou]